MNARTAIACASALLLSACAGDGEGLDENGRPLTGGETQPPPLLPQLSSIQSEVFTPICTTCHAGAGAPLGLRLEEGVSFAMLVNVQSTEVPSLARVAPGNPDASYLIQKIEGTAAVGGRMPLNGPPLPAETIAVIRQWIANGAPQSVSATSEKPAQLTAAWPPAGATLAQMPREIVISSDAELDWSLLAAGTVSLRRSGGDASFSEQNEHDVPVSVELRSLQPTVVALRANTPQLPGDSFELRISGGDPLALADRFARPIDGDHDGRPGGDFVVRFTVEGAR
jgi:hypothetical protein